MRIVIFFLLFFSLPIQAAELFGVALSSAQRDQIREAVKQAGVELVSEAGDDAFFDVYSSSEILGNSTHLYLGFVKKDNRFAFAEYEFNGIKQPALVTRLEQKYGKARIKNGKFFSDKTYSWQSDKTQITLAIDWDRYKTRLIYQNSEALKALIAEQKTYQNKLVASQLTFNDWAY